MVLGLDEHHMGHARAVLREFGNMSSATILFVLERTLRLESPVPGEWGVMDRSRAGLCRRGGVAALVRCSAVRA
jgi:predicted naringenin-chalcone synthase